jgi:hypothetical protein
MKEQSPFISGVNTSCKIDDFAVYSAVNPIKCLEEI